MTLPARILAYPHPTLRATCKALGLEDKAIWRPLQQLVITLKETMHDAKGIGLSAPQIGVACRVFIVHVPAETKQALVFVNPTILATSEGTINLNEGCLSFDRILEPITRPKRVTVARSDEYGRRDEHEFGGWTARAIQHEIEHLDGKLIIDHMAPAAKRMLDRWLARKAAKRAPPDAEKVPA